MAKSYDDETNEVLRALARKVKIELFSNNQTQMADEIGISASFLSDFLNEKRGAGLDMLVGLGKFAPLDLLNILGIDLGSVALLALPTSGGAEGVMGLPDVVRRAARACIELTGCSPGEAGEAAVEAYETHGNVLNTDADWWQQKIRDIVKGRARSGERPSVRLLPSAKSQEP